MIVSSIDRVRSIALISFLEGFRSPLLLNSLLVGTGLLVLAFIGSSLTFGDPVRILRTVGISGCGIASGIAAVLLGATSLGADISNRKIGILLSSRLSRFEYLSGRVLGLFGTLLSLYFGLTVLLVLEFGAFGATLSWADYLWSLSFLLRASNLLVVGSAFSCLSHPSLAVGCTLAYWVVATSLGELISIASLESSSEFLYGVTFALGLLVPVFESVDLASVSLYGDDFVVPTVLGSIVGLLALTCAQFLLASIFFDRASL